MNHPDLDELARRPLRYWNADGVPELMMGLLWIVWGGAWLIGQALPHGWPAGVYWLVVPPVLALSMAAVNPIIRRIKQRVTFPRGGYVEWQQPGGHSRRLAVAAIVVAALALAVVVLAGTRVQTIEQRLPPILSAVLSLGFLALSVRQRAPHYLAFAAVAIVVTVVTTWLAAGWDSISWTFVALGAACVAFGAIRLAQFLRANPIAPTEGL